MSREEALNKLESGSYIIVPKWLSVVRNIVSPLAIVSLIFFTGAWKTTIESTSFSTPEQKERVVQFVEKGETITSQEKTQIINDINHNSKEINTIKVQMDNFIPRNELTALLESIAKDTRYNKELLLELKKNQHN